MLTEYNLSRFIEAQEGSYSIVLRELKNGKKESHWLWYIFPQIKGLGKSPTSQYYAIHNIEEATEYLNDKILGVRLIETCNILFELDCNNIEVILGQLDSLKLQSCLTLFAQIENTNSIFKKLLNKFYNNKFDELTLNILNKK